jgi:osmoprotectant transport system substrate-binding protein
MKGAVSGGPEKVYDQVKEFYEKQYKVTWLNPTAIDNGYVLTVRQDTADRYALKTLSDLGKVAGALTLGAGPEFADRRDGIPGLKAVYGVEFKEFKQFAKLGLRYDALSGKQIDVANGFATDWQLGEQKLVTIEDDKHLFQPYLVAPVVRLDVLAQNPKIADILNKVSALLDNKTMQTLNARVEQNHEDAADVADDFLKAKGLVN